MGSYLPTLKRSIEPSKISCLTTNYFNKAVYCRDACKYLLLSSYHLLMKRILALLLLLPVFSFAQDCALKKYLDKFSNDPRLTTGTIKLNAGHLLSIDADSKEIDVFFMLGSNGGDAKCFDDASTATVTYEGGKLKANFKNTGSMNCEGYFHFTFKNAVATPSLLQRLGTLKIASIVFTAGKTKTEILLTDEQKAEVAKKISCITTEAKTLIKKP